MVGKWVAKVVILAGAGLLSDPAKAGFLMSPSVKLATFSVRPEVDEATPNYYGIGAGLELGFSFRQVFDLAVVGSYIPARLESARAGADDAVLQFYGGGVAFRIANALYLGLRGGMASYQLFHETRAAELSGQWHGPAGGFAIGALFKLGKQSFVQTSFEVMHTVVTDRKEEVEGKRRFDSFAVSLAYVFNDFSSYYIENEIFKDFLDSVIFF